jgi:hypothetical protein
MKAVQLRRRYGGGLEHLTEGDQLESKWEYLHHVNLLRQLLGWYCSTNTLSPNFSYNELLPCAAVKTRSSLTLFRTVNSEAVVVYGIQSRLCQ